MIKSRYRGHVIIFVEECWLYESDKVLVMVDMQRPCGHCGKENTKEGHDACLGILPGVRNACCGHGDKDSAYVQFEDKTIVQADSAIAVFNRMSSRVGIASIIEEDDK